MRIKHYLGEAKGVPIDDIWTDISPVNSQSAERIGLSRQKPEALIERIILASSNKGDVILDPFSGSGTTVVVANKLNRKWVGIDISQLAISVTRYRLSEQQGDEKNYKVYNVPNSFEEAKEMAKRDINEFTWWILGLLKAKPSIKKEDYEKGIDGRIYFYDDNSGEKKKVIISVNAEYSDEKQIIELKNNVNNEDAQIGAAIFLNPPNENMLTEAKIAGIYKSPWGLYNKIQLFTVKELLTGMKIDIPPASKERLITKPVSNKKELYKQKTLLRKNQKQDN